MAFFAGLMGLVEWLDPSQPPFTGKGASIKAIAHANLGAHGVALLLVVFALASWRTAVRKDSSHGSEERQ